jgi:hypothetical protein
MDFMYCLRHDFGGTKPSQKNPLKVDILAHAYAQAGANAGCAGWPGRAFGLNEARQGIDVGQLPRKEIALLRNKPSKAWPMS